MEEGEKSDDRFDVQRLGQTGSASNDTEFDADRQSNSVDFVATADHVWTPKEVGQILRQLGDNLERIGNEGKDSRAQKKG